MLASTLNPPEQLSISLEDMLHRLFHEEELSASETGTVFRCSYSRASGGEHAENVWPAKK